VRAGDITLGSRVEAQGDPGYGDPAAFAFPLFGFALLVYHHHFGWPGDERTREITKSLLFEPG
jgi:hypothetical protein